MIRAMGMYSLNEGDYGKWPVNQTYSESVLALGITPKPLTAAILQQAQQDPSDLPGNTTAASSQLFEVWIDPAPAPAGYWASTGAAPAVVITPNGDTAKKPQ
jgi:hypothetical protein